MRKENKKLTTESLRKYPGLEYLSEEEAQNIVCSLEQLSYLLCNMFLRIEKEKVKTPKENDIY
jgi:hypothetical protein